MRYDSEVDMRWLKSWVTGGADELGWDDLVRRAAKAIAEQAHYGPRGALAFPPEVDVDVAAPAGEVDVAREFVEDPDFDRQVAAALENRCDCPPSVLPFRSYSVAEGARLSLRARGRAGAPSRWVFRVAGGDSDDKLLELPAGRSEIRFGRGEWHGGDRQIQNDLIVCEDCPFVSRRAGKLLVTGNLLEVESLDQGDLLFVRRAQGQTIRPARAASGRAALREGDAVELSDGGELQIRLCLERRRA